MLEQAATCPAATCSNKRQHVRLQHAQTGGIMSVCNMLEQARWQLVWLQHAQTGGNMSGCNMVEQMLEQAATCPAATCLK
jgi:hypothetical protein